MFSFAVPDHVYQCGIDAGGFAFFDFILFSRFSYTLWKIGLTGDASETMYMYEPMPGEYLQLSTIGKVLAGIWLCQMIVSSFACVGVRHQEVRFILPYLVGKVLSILMTTTLFMPAALYLYHSGHVSVMDPIVTGMHLLLDMIGFIRTVQFVLLLTEDDTDASDASTDDDSSSKVWFKLGKTIHSLKHACAPKKGLHVSSGDVLGMPNIDLGPHISSGDVKGKEFKMSIDQ